MEKMRLHKGVLLQRRMRFLADVTLNSGETVTAHVANSGSLKGLAITGAAALLSQSDNPNRKLAYTLEALQDKNGQWIGINTSQPNAWIFEAIQAGKIPSLTGYPSAKREVKYGKNSRIDILLQGHSSLEDAYVEVKNVSLFRTKGLAEFPDSVTARGTKHLHELMDMRTSGHRAIMVFCIQAHAEVFKIADDIDPNYAKAFKDALNAGVEALAVSYPWDETGRVKSEKTDLIKILSAPNNHPK